MTKPTTIKKKNKNKKKPQKNNKKSIGVVSVLQDQKSYRMDGGDGGITM